MSKSDSMPSPEKSAQTIRTPAVQMPDGSMLDASKAGFKSALAAALYKDVLAEMIRLRKARGAPIPPKALAKAKEMGIEV